MEKQKKKMNICFFMTDQHRWDALGCVTPVVKTPNLDSLAAVGIRFDQAVCNAPMCVPSRYSMMTGLYPSQMGIRNNTCICHTDESLPLPVMPQRLQELGYQTAGFGKAHWYITKKEAVIDGITTSRRGFEIRAEAWPADPQCLEPGALNMQIEEPDDYEVIIKEETPFGPGCEDPGGYMGITSELQGDRHREGWLTSKALDFLDKQRDHERPFFLYLSFDYPHPGFNVPPGYEEPYDINQIEDRPIPGWEAHPEGHVSPDRRRGNFWGKLSPMERRIATLRYYALCSYVDDCFGRVIKKLKDMGEYENTCFVFVSDHGEMLGDRHHRFSKYCMYDGSIRVPVILAGPCIPEEKKGIVDSRPAELVDILPTVLDIAGVYTPELAGFSLLKPCPRQGSFTEMHGSGGEDIQKAPVYTWRTKNWKLILFLKGNIAEALYNPGSWGGELFNLATDPWEWDNLYYNDEYIHVKEEMTRSLLLHLAVVWAKFPRQRTNCRLY